MVILRERRPERDHAKPFARDPKDLFSAIVKPATAVEDSLHVDAGKILRSAPESSVEDGSARRLPQIVPELVEASKFLDLRGCFYPSHLEIVTQK